MFWKRNCRLISSELDGQNNIFGSDLSHVYMWVRIKIKDVTQYEYITWIEQILCSKQIQKTDLHLFFFFLQSLPEIFIGIGILRDTVRKQEDFIFMLAGASGTKNKMHSLM